MNARILASPASTLAAALVLCAASAFAQPVGVKFVSAGGSYRNNSSADALAPSESAGAPEYAQTNWNNLGQWGDSAGWSGTAVVLTNSAGAATPLSIMWDSTGAGSTGTGTGLGTPDGKLMNGFLNSWNWDPWTTLAGSVYGSGANNKPLTYIGNLNAWCQAQGAIGYKVVVYVTSGNTWWQTIATSVESVTGSPLDNNMVEGSALMPPRYSKMNGLFSGTYKAITSTNSGSPTDGSGYIVFYGLTNDAVLIRQNNGGAISGFQIVPVLGPTINHPPVAGSSFTLGAMIGTPTTVQIVGGKWTPTDSDNDALVVTSVTGAASGTVTTDGTNITYTATGGTTDSFTYTVSDGHGGTANQTVNVTIGAASQGFNQMNAQVVSGNLHLTYLGIPGSKYALDWTHSLTPPTWLPLVTNTAAANGYLLFTNTPSGGSDFYRTRYVP